MEIWKRHTIHKEIEVSDLGNIRLFLTKQIKRIYISDTGYRKVSVNTNNGRKSLRVNRLIAYMFCENPNNYPIVMHLNDIKTDDRAVNLKYGTASENLKGRFISKYKRLKKSDILIIKQKIKEGVPNVDIAKQFNTTYKNISNIKTGFRHQNVQLC